MKSLLFSFLVVLSLQSFAQNKILKFDCKGSFVESYIDSTKNITDEAYHLLVIDLEKGKVDIYPDSMNVNIVSEISKRQVGDRLVLSFNCIDKFNRNCTANLSYKSKMPELLKLQWKEFSFYYFIVKQTQ